MRVLELQVLPAQVDLCRGAVMVIACLVHQPRSMHATLEELILELNVLTAVIEKMSLIAAIEKLFQTGATGKTGTETGTTAKVTGTAQSPAGVRGERVVVMATTVGGDLEMGLVTGQIA